MGHTRTSIADEHCIILPIIIVDLVLLECSGKDLPGRVVQADFEALQIILTILTLRPRRSRVRLQGTCVGVRGVLTRGGLAAYDSGTSVSRPVCVGRCGGLSSRVAMDVVLHALWGGLGRLHFGRGLGRGFGRLDKGCPFK